MRAILVDDEALSLHYLSGLLRKIGGVEILGIYMNPYEAIEAVLTMKPTMVFLDIEMPGMNGMEVAEKIQQSSPDTRIIFVTAFSEYAVNAFEMNAVDYLMKPVQLERLHKTLQRLTHEAVNVVAPTVPTRSAMVFAFQSLSFAWSGDSVDLVDVRWRTSKVRGVFAFLLQHRGSFVRKDLLLEHFWPEVDGEKGFIQLYSTIYQIRKSIAATNFDIVIVNQENGYRLDLNSVKFDVDEWENRLKQASAVRADTIGMHRQLLALYQGDYLAKEDYVWAEGEGERERLRILWLQHVSDVADYLEADKQFSEAISLYLRVQISQPFVDESYFKLMQLYSQLGNFRAVDQQYEQLTNMLQDEYEAKPRVIVQKWYESWVARGGLEV